MPPDNAQPGAGAEDLLDEAGEFFHGAFENAPIGMALVDLAGRFTRVNEALCQITGVGRGRLESMGLEEIVHPDDLDAVREGMAALDVSGQTLYAAEKRFVHASGQPAWVALQLTLIAERAGKPLHLWLHVQDMTDRKRYEDKLQHLADHDALTGLVNRGSLARDLDLQAARVERYGAEGALLMLDVDHFKEINDMLGPHVGDELIVHVAGVLASRLRETDVLARIGGDEFAVLLPKADAVSARLVALDLLQALREEPITSTSVAAGAISVSIGVALFGPQMTGEDVLISAGLAMYDAKEAGRDRVTMSRAEQHERTRLRARLSWAQRIRDALDDDRFTLLGQPIVELSTGRVDHYELLLRMRDEHDDLIPPALFLPIAERLGMIHEIDAWVVRRALGLLAEHDDPASVSALSVNVSRRAIADTDLVALLEEQLVETGVSPTKLLLETTETAAIEQITKARRFSQHLAALGCRLALDDFGAGLGAFSYLQHLTFDYLKIDGRLVRSARSSEADRLVIEAIVSIAHALGKQTIAKYVAEEETARLLADLGVDYGQGYHFGRPAPVPPPVGAPEPLQEQ